MMSGRFDSAIASAAVSIWVCGSAAGRARVDRRVEAAGSGGFDEVERNLNGGRSLASRTHRRQGLSDGQGHLAGAGDAVDFGEDRPTAPPSWLRTSWRSPLPRPGWVSGIPGTDEEDRYRVGE
jgi:hypothetical protein